MSLDIKLNLGCGNKRKEGFINVDIIKTPAVDVIANVNKKLPWSDNCVSEVHSTVLLEHLENYIGFIEELYRISKDGALWIFEVPHFSGGLYSPFHIRFFAYDAFTHYSKFDKERSHSISEGVKLKVVKVYITFEKRWYLPWNYIVEPIVNASLGSRKLARFYERSFLRSIFPGFLIKYNLKVIK